MVVCHINCCCSIFSKITVVEREIVLIYGMYLPYADKICSCLDYSVGSSPVDQPG